MSKPHPKTIIELNGKRYDARTGQIVDVPTPPQTAHAVVVPAPPAAEARVVDGFIKPVKSHSSTAPARRRNTAAHSPHHKPQRAKTLMRHAVHKPQSIRTVSVLGSSPAPSDGQDDDLLIKPIDQRRLKLATQIHKNKLITRFGATTRPSFIKKAVPLAVRPAPAHAHSAGQSPKPHATTHSSHDPFATVIASLNNATHTQAVPKPHKTAKHLRGNKLRISAAGLSVLVLAGFYAYLNTPSLALRYASSRAGIAASMPGYQPSGFNARNAAVVYSKGKVSIRFQSNTDARNFSVTQESSDLNSETLLSSFVAQNQEPYQTYQDNGKTIYMYGNSNATWIDSGIWYRVEGNSLNSDQLLKIASSM